MISVCIQNNNLFLSGDKYEVTIGRSHKFTAFKQSILPKLEDAYKALDKTDNYDLYLYNISEMLSNVCIDTSFELKHILEMPDNTIIGIYDMI